MEEDGDQTEGEVSLPTQVVSDQVDWDWDIQRNGNDVKRGCVILRAQPVMLRTDFSEVTETPPRVWRTYCQNCGWRSEKLLKRDQCRCGDPLVKVKSRGRSGQGPSWGAATAGPILAGVPLRRGREYT